MIDRLLIHESIVQTYLGTSGSGDQYAPAITLDCYAEDEPRLVRDQSGAEVVSSTTIIYDLDETTLTALTVQSKVTVFGRTSTVLTVGRGDTAGLYRSVEHLEVTLL